MLKYKFPYGIQIKRNGKITLLPVISAWFYNDSKKILRFLLIDSGAETTLLTRGDAELLGIEVTRGIKVLIDGIGLGSLPAFRHEIQLEIGKEKFKIPVLFSTSDETPRILGREGMFEYFYILFDEKGQQTIFIPRSPDSQKKLKTILNNR